MPILNKVQGVREIEAEMKRLGAKMSQSLISRAVKRSAQPMEAAAKAHAPVGNKTVVYKGQSYGPGRLRNSIYTEIKEFGGSTVADVKPKVPYAWLVEYGHKIVRVSKKTGRKRVVGFAAPHAYMRPAFDSSVAKSLQILEQELRSAFLG